ncbi:uncharacterized protein TNCV_2948771 [Trichonephila clavipes]|nr:uncharacterized protein TNCV_2948771 [Trichonephila clavipes]
MFPQIDASQLAWLCAHGPISDAVVDVSAMMEILYKGALVHNPWCSRRQRIDEIDISTPVAVDQRAANCLEESVRSFTAMRSRCRSLRAYVTFRRPLPVFQVFRCSSVQCFQLFRCTRAPIAL